MERASADFAWFGWVRTDGYTSYPEYHRLVGYLRDYNSEPIALAVGGNTLFQIFDERYYASLEGGILEGLGKLFRPNVRMYVYPQRQNDGTLIHVESFEPPESVREIYQYLVKHEALETVGLTGNYFSPLSSRDILKTMHSGSDSWIPSVPAPVASLIQERALFGYRNGVKKDKVEPVSKAKVPELV